MPEILSSVTTPLILVALFLLLLSQFVNILARHGKITLSQHHKTLLINYGFLISFGLVVIAVAAYLVGQFLEQEVRLSGTVMSTSGQFVKDARVDIVGTGNDITNAGGAFSIVIPKTRQANTYLVSVIADGFESRKMEIVGPSPKPSIITLTPLNSGTLVRIDHSLFVTHFIGSPSVAISVDFKNPSDIKREVRDIRAKLTAPNGRTFDLVPIGMSVMSPYAYWPPLVFVSLDPHSDQKWYLAFGIPSNFVQTMTNKLRQIPEFSQIAPCTNNVAPNDAAAKILQETFDQQFAWSEHEWQLEVTMSYNGEDIPWARAFTLSSSDLQGLRESIALLLTCQLPWFNVQMLSTGNKASYLIK